MLWNVNKNIDEHENAYLRIFSPDYSSDFRFNWSRVSGCIKAGNQADLISGLHLERQIFVLRSSTVGVAVSC